MIFTTRVIEFTVVVVVHPSAIADALLMIVVTVPVIRVTVHVIHALLAPFESVRVRVGIVPVMPTVVMVANIHLDVVLSVAARAK